MTVKGQTNERQLVGQHRMFICNMIELLQDKRDNARGWLELLSPWEVKAYCPSSGLAFVTLESSMAGFHVEATGPMGSHLGNSAGNAVPVIFGMINVARVL